MIYNVSDLNAIELSEFFKGAHGHTVYAICMTGSFVQILKFGRAVLFIFRQQFIERWRNRINSSSFYHSFTCHKSEPNRKQITFYENRYIEAYYMIIREVLWVTLLQAYLKPNIADANLSSQKQLSLAEMYIYVFVQVIKRCITICF